jgi:hypothetical protein
MTKNLSYYYPWERLDENQFYRTVREFTDNGCRRFVITDEQLRQLIASDEKVEFLHKLCKDMEVEFPSVHALCGNNFDLSWSVHKRRAGLVADHIKAMEIAASFGCRTYVLHVGAAEYCYNHIPMDGLRDLAVDTLEKVRDQMDEDERAMAETWTEDEGDRLRHAMGDYENNLIVTPQDIDALIDRTARLLATAANQAIHRNVDREQMDLLCRV